MVIVLPNACAVTFWHLKLTAYMSIISQKRWKKWVLSVSGGRALRKLPYLCPLTSPHHSSTFPYWHDKVNQAHLSFPSSAWEPIVLVEKGVQKLGSGDWCHYCHWNVAVSSNLGIYVCTQSHTQTQRHTSIVIHQSSHNAHLSNTSLHGNLEFQ